jgi:Arc/MetJ family transcription regulator
MRTTVDLDDALAAAAERRAAHDGITLASLLEAGLRHVLGEPATDPEQRDEELLLLAEAVGSTRPEPWASLDDADLDHAVAALLS